VDENQTPTLESELATLSARVAALETKPSTTVDTALTARVKKVEDNHANLLTRLRRKLGDYL
jgi:hypothetical protein